MSDDELPPPVLAVSFNLNMPTVKKRTRVPEQSETDKPPGKNKHRSAKKAKLGDAEPVARTSHGDTVKTAKLDRTEPVVGAPHDGSAPVKQTKVGRIEPIAVTDVFCGR